ncbi:MAG TPA: protein kinase [Planctomycetota bacterium]|nr:protein kinase [Planctomycetota bacterium]
MQDAANALLKELTESKGNPPIIGGVVIHNLIGSGGMGAVFKGSHLRLRIPVAVKFLYDQDEEFIVQFINEATLAAKVNHTNVVRVYDVNKEGKFQYIIQEYIEGQSAEQRLIDAVTTGKPLSEDFVLGLAADIARGLAALHAESFLHLDIKPGNVMISNRDGVCKILDLGLARRLDVARGGEGIQNRERIAGGTPGYASPEQLQFHSIGPTSDIYSLGVSMYDLLAGRRLHSANTWHTAIKEQTTRDVPDIRSLRPDVSEATSKLIDRCVRVEPEYRFQSAMELLSQLANANQARLSKPMRTPTAVPRGTALRALSPTVFCVDDDAEFATLLGEMLEGGGYRVETFTDGPSALARMRRMIPDVVLLDLEMPGMNGLQVCKEMRALDSLKSIPVVFLTGNSSPDSMNLAMHEGATDYLFKPVQASDLIARVRCLARITRAQRELESLEQQYGSFKSRLTTIFGKETHE